MKRTTDADRQAAPANPDYFVGDVAMTVLNAAPDPARVRVLSVSFQPGARTNWHTHPFGQTLIVTEGEGRVQTEGGPVKPLRPGDVIWFAPGERHWHGAGLDTPMTHIAIQEADDGKTADWEGPVSDVDYEAPLDP